jgi:hypothetical protein
MDKLESRRHFRVLVTRQARRMKFNRRVRQHLSPLEQFQTEMPKGESRPPLFGSEIRTNSDRATSCGVRWKHALDPCYGSGL